jgi:hypothetical protein
MDFDEVSFPLRVYRVYQVSTDLTSLPLLISAVFPVYKQNNTRLNFGSVAAQVAPPQLKLLNFNSPSCFYPNSVSQSNYRKCRTILVIVFHQFYAKDSSRGELAIRPRIGPHCESGSEGPEIGHPIKCPRTGPFI